MRLTKSNALLRSGLFISALESLLAGNFTVQLATKNGGYARLNATRKGVLFNLDGAIPWEQIEEIAATMKEQLK